MSANQPMSSQVVRPRYATPGELAEAVEALSDDEKWKLRLLAHLCARSRGLREGGEELFYESLYRALQREGDDRWDMTACDIFIFMRRAIDTTAKTLENQLYVDRNDRSRGFRYTSGTSTDPEQTDLLDQYPSPWIDHCRAYDAKEMVEKIFKLFEGDEAAIALIRRWFDMTPRGQIMEELGLSVQDYETIERRINRKIRRAGIQFTPEVDAWRRTSN